ncbi:unnamed protein product, partial [Didymodactylos carnosus]
MSPAPLDDGEITVVDHENLNNSSMSSILNQDADNNNTVLLLSGENALTLGLGHLSLESMENVDLGDIDELEIQSESQEAEISSPLPLSTSSAPATPTGERGQVQFRNFSQDNRGNSKDSQQLEVKYSSNKGLLDSFLGCLKPIWNVWGKIYQDNLKTPTTVKDQWEYPLDSIVELVLIGNGMEGQVYRGKLNDMEIACKRVRTLDETKIHHLKKLNHVNVVKFKGICVSAPMFYILMEYCQYGTLHDVLKRRRENSCTKPTQVLDWSKQISLGMNYLHANKIIHRDLKSPNILIGAGEKLKISDFGTCKQMLNRRSQVMSFNGTHSWMAPEVIRQEPCSEKVDIWSFGVVLWEILTCQIPYHNIDPSSVMFGVGKGSLTLPIPSSAPEGLKLLMTMCWNQTPRNRPSFQQVLTHLDVNTPEIILFEQEQEYQTLKHNWSIEINEKLKPLPTIDMASVMKLSHDQIRQKRVEELQHIQDIRHHYHKKLQQTNTLYLELTTLMVQLEQRENEIIKKERVLNINSGKQKRLISPLLKYQYKLYRRASSLQMKLPNTINNDNVCKVHTISNPLLQQQQQLSRLRHSSQSSSTNKRNSSSLATDSHEISNNSPKTSQNPVPSNTTLTQQPSQCSSSPTASKPRVRKRTSHQRSGSGSQKFISTSDSNKQTKCINSTSNVVNETSQGTMKQTSLSKSSTDMMMAPISHKRTEYFTSAVSVPSISADIELSLLTGNSTSSNQRQPLSRRGLTLEIDNPITTDTFLSMHKRSSTISAPIPTLFTYG